MKLSVLVTTYNQAKYIAQCLESILLQKTDFAYEILIGDDASTDGTSEICRKYADTHPGQIRLFIRRPEEKFYINGKPTGRNNFVDLMQKATGTYIARCEGDDYWTASYKLQKQVDLLDAHPETAVCFHNAYIMYDSSDKPLTPYCSPRQPEVSDIRTLFDSNYIYTCSVMFRNVLGGALPGWFFETPMGDWPLHILAARHGDIRYINEIMACRREHAGSVWHTMSAVDQRLKTIQALNLFAGHFASNKEYATLIRKSIAKQYTHIARFFKEAGDLKNYQKYDATAGAAMNKGKSICDMSAGNNLPYKQSPPCGKRDGKYLNLGCGSHFHRAWTNVDFHSGAEGVIAHDLNKGISFEDNLFDAVYHSHLLEHFPKRHAPLFMLECFRVLRPGGTIRVAVPDLEQIVRLYLALLDKSLEGDKESQKKYDWIMLELFDQITRASSGGEMLDYWRQAPMPAEDFVIERVGTEVLSAINKIRGEVAPLTSRESSPAEIRTPADALSIGNFRLSGEVHQWMYDRYSLAKLLESAGFVSIRVCKADESSIPDFNSYHLDVLTDGSVRKPDSLFMEGIKETSSGTYTVAGPTGTTKESKKRNHSPKIVHLCSFDHSGAGKAAYRLHKGLQAGGIDSTMIVLNKNSRDASVKVVPDAFSDDKIVQGMDVPEHSSPLYHRQVSRWTRILAGYPGRPEGLEMFTDAVTDGRLDMLREVREADVINLHWMAGMMDYRHNSDVLSSKELFWTLHDMNPFTGGCHYSGDCAKYLTHCGACPQLGSDIEQDLSYFTWERKRLFYKYLNLTVVTPSKWLAECAARSALFSGLPVHVIPNGFPLDVFKPYPKEEVRNLFNIEKPAKVILFGADSVTDRRKGFSYLVDALQNIRLKAEDDLLLMTFGYMPETEPPPGDHPTITLGQIRDEERLAKAYNAADLFVIPSIEDNLPNTVMEAMACGVPVVGFRTGGIPDMIEHRHNGYLAEPRDVEGIINGIKWIFEQDSAVLSKLCRAKAEKEFSLKVQADAYRRLYDAGHLTTENSGAGGRLRQTHELNRKGEDLFAQGDITGAVDLFQKAVETCSDFSTAFNNLGVIFFNEDKLEESMRYFEKALDIDPFDRATVFNYSQALARAKRIHKTKAILVQYLSLNPGDPEISGMSAETDAALGKVTELNDMAELRAREGDTESAYRIFNEIVDVCADYSPAYNNMGVLSWQQGRAEDALALFSKALELDPDDRHTVINYGEALKALQRDEEANYLYESYLKKYPNDADISGLLSKTPDNSNEAVAETVSVLNELIGLTSSAEFGREKPVSPDTAGVEKKAAAAGKKRTSNGRSYPKISIVTPSFNQCSYLEECIDSVLSQNYCNLEYIIMDGGSTDGSVEIIKKHEKYLKYWQSKPDGGQYAAVNEGFRRTDGEIMAWLNSDDKYHPWSFWIAAEVFAGMQGVQWLTGRPTAWDDKGKLVYVSQTLPEWSREKYLKRQFQDAFIQQESTFWRRSLWKNAGSFLDTSLKYAADFELWARFFRSARLHVVDELLGGFRYQASQKTAHFFEEYKSEVHKVIDRELEVFNNNRDRALPAHADPISPSTVLRNAGTLITPENFSYFTYSKTTHFSCFKNNAVELYGQQIDTNLCDLKAYQDLLVYTFIKENLPKGSRLLEIGGGDSRIINLIRKDYECWNLDKLEGAGNGPTRINVEGFHMVKDYIGSFSKELPADYFDLVFSISVLEHTGRDGEIHSKICRDIERVMKPGALSLHCFDIVAEKTNVRANPLLFSLFESFDTLNKFIPLSRLPLDPNLYVMSESSYNANWRSITKKTYPEFGRPLSYNVLWRKDFNKPGLPSFTGNAVKMHTNLEQSSVDNNAPEEPAKPSCGALIATSISPHNLSLQKKAISSWLENGFQVASLNSREEIAAISSHFPEVTFIPAARDARDLAGKPLIFFDDVIAYLQQSKASICGIVNSDIILDVNKSLIAFLEKESENALIIGHRVDIPDEHSRSGNVYVLGYDYFFFNRLLPLNYPASGFCLGMPWWDYWAFLIPYAHNIPIKKFSPPIGYHVRHSANYKPHSWNAIGLQFVNHLRSNGLSEFCAAPIPHKGDPAVVDLYLRTVCASILGFIDRHAVKITLPVEQAAPYTTPDPISDAAEAKNISQPETPELYKNIQQLLDAGAYEDAMSALKKFIYDDPSCALAHNDIAALYYQKDNKDSALLHFRQAVSLEPDNTIYQRNLANLLVEMNHFSDALSVLSKLAQEHPEDVETLISTGSLCNRLGAKDDAKMFWNAALTLDPGNETALKHLDLAALQTVDAGVSRDGNKYKVSAIVSTYNSEKFMAGCLQDLIDQTLYRKGLLEIVVVDSGSAQNEKAIVRSFQERYSDIKYIRTNERETVYQAWNRGIRAASGQYVINANTDDRHRPDALEIMSRRLDAHPEIALLYANQLATNVPNQTFETVTPINKIDYPDFSRETLLEFGCCTSQPMWRMSLHTVEGLFFDERYEVVGDYDFWLRISKHHDIAKIHETLGIYYISPKEENKEFADLYVRNEESYLMHRKYYLEDVESLPRERLIEELQKNLEEAKRYFMGKSHKSNSPHGIAHVEQTLMQACIILELLGDMEKARIIARDFFRIHNLSYRLAFYLKQLTVSRKTAPQITAGPVVSIIVPVLHETNTLEETIESVLSQTYCNIEIVVVVNTPIANTESILGRLSEEYPTANLILAPVEGLGLAALLQCGVYASAGELILLLHPADLLAFDYLEKTVSELQKTPSADVVFTETVYFGNRNEIGESDDFSMSGILSRPMLTMTALFRKACWEEVKGLDEGLKDYETWDFWISLGKKGFVFRKVSEPLFFYRDRKGIHQCGTEITEADKKLGLIKKHRDLYHIPSKMELPLLSRKQFIYPFFVKWGAPEGRKKAKPSGSEKTRILFVCQNFLPYEFAGAQLYAYYLAKELINLGYDISIFHPLDVADIKAGESAEPYRIVKTYYEDIPVYQVTVKAHIKPMYKFYDDRIEALFRELLDKENFHVVHYHHLFRLSGSLPLVSKRMNIPSLAIIHDFWPLCILYVTDTKGSVCSGPESMNKCEECLSNDTNFPGFKVEDFLRERTDLFKAAYDSIDYKCSPSRYLAEMFDRCGFKDVKTLPLGWLPVKRKRDKPVGENIIFGYVGQIIHRKGLDILLDAITGLTSGNWQLHIYGECYDPPFFKLITEKMRNRPNIKYMGGYKPEQLPDIFSEIDAAILPSRGENYPLVILEALSAGIPVIASDAGGTKETFRPNVEGFLFRNGDVPELRSILKKITDKPQLLEKIKKGIGHVKTIRENALEWHKLYAECLAGKKEA